MLMGHAALPQCTAVLVVEDEPLIRIDLAGTLQAAGLDVLEAANADEAIEILSSRLDICVVVTDIEMPGSMDGLKLARLVEDRWPPVHVIVTSGRRVPQMGDLPESSHFFSKPYDVPKLVETVRAYMPGH